MPNWLKKSLVVLISILTFGMVTPQDLLADQPKNDSQSPKTFSSMESDTVVTETVITVASKEELIENLMDDAQKITSEKLGQRVMPRIEREFQSQVLPEMEKVISSLVQEYPPSEYHHLIISPAIGKGDGERIFHIMDEQTKEDVLCFHVRRDQPPLEGFTFNFHYHTQKDHFESHNMISSIYWGKDTPPKFGSKRLH
ncbi:YpjP family protein [Jeotgalibacillus proteolyticus]|uniref:YpjP family protein n=1 Tax=Jeotgalibacillus proteolyticus TaxID=2082395 RepID=UPI003CEA8CEA